MHRSYPRLTRSADQSGINMVDLMMWLVIAALILSAAIQGIGYYQQAAYAYQAKSDLASGHTWATSRTSLTSSVPTVEELQDALTINDYNISNSADLALIASSSGQKYCFGIKAANVKTNNVFYSTSDDPSNVKRSDKMPEGCGTPGEAGGPGAPAADSDNDGTPNISDNDIDNDGIPNTVDPDMDGDGIPNESDPDIDGDREKNSKDDTPNGYSSDTDTDGDGVLDSADDDIDGDGTLNFSDDDIDGDGSLNPGDFTAYGEGSYSGPSTNPSTQTAPSGLLTDTNVVIDSVAYDGNGQDVNFNLIIQVGAGGMIGKIYHFQYRITCSLPDGSQFYKLGNVETSYKSSSPSSVLFKGSCPQDGGLTTAVGYVAGAYNSHPALIRSSSYRGPANVATGGIVTPLRGHDESATAAAGSIIDPRVLIRNVKIKDGSIDVGMANEVGHASSIGHIYGLQYRITCQLPDGSQYYKHGVLQTSYKPGDYPAPVFNFACVAGSTARGYIVGPDGGDPALNSSIGYKGPRNVMRGGIVSPLEGLTPSTVAANQAYSNARLSIRTLTYSGNTASIGVNVNLGGVTYIGGNFHVSYQLTCKTPATGAITYKVNRLQTSYGNGSSNPALTLSAACNVGDEVIGAIAGPYAGHPALTSGSSYGGPVNYAVVGQQ